jgi:mercuric ion transport protein
MPAIRRRHEAEPVAMKDAIILRTGIIGSIVAAICCFTPVLVIGLGVVGLSAWLGWIDYVLFPALAIFLALTAWALWRRRAEAGYATDAHSGEEGS